MASVKTYVDQMRTRLRVIASKYGSDVEVTDKQTRVLIVSVLTLIAVLIKTLVDKGVITDAELLAQLNTARDDTYDDQPG